MQPSLLIVDDDLDTVEIFKEFLEIKGFNVIGTGKNGKEAVEKYQELKPSVVLLDVMMPDYDGIYGLQGIRKIDPDANVIMVTADKTTKTEERLKDLNANDVLYKPYEIDDVVSAINKAVVGSMKISC
ncbi:MAG: response regulator [Crenarchaeota archaeon]|nr:MAG: response regulator [Thermoproteota archaeon]RDJ33486.1 MAG: response regulator [Thermoproteota archaeon]RDJ34898.1 MAG: response regulator [Thermoproteota archaeon]RDJ38399.1 MAG: response regulator [Thermoproteota archaeon]